MRFVWSFVFNEYILLRNTHLLVFFSIDDERREKIRKRSKISDQISLMLFG